MKRFASAFLCGVVSGFWLLALFYWQYHGPSFTLAFRYDRLYLLHAVTYIALGLLAFRVWRLIRGRRVRIEFGILDASVFVIGVVALAAAYLVWRQMSPDGDDPKYVPYVIMPVFFVVALVSFYGVVAIK
jgi:uncharacterized membrane protein YidH (DUF202 family)